MYILVNHKINNPESFWKSAQENQPNLPEQNVQRVMQSLPNADMTMSSCVWEADSIDALDTYLRSKMGDWSEESYYEINTQNALGFAG